VFFYAALFCVGTGLAMFQCPVQRVLPKYLKSFIVSEVISELEELVGPNQQNVRDVPFK